MKPILKYPPQTQTLLIRPGVLPGDVVQLEPLNLNHVPELTIAAAETKWDLLFDAALYRKWGLAGLVQELIRRQEEDETDIPFAVIHRATKVAVGITRYLHIDKANRKLEIATWLAKDFRRAGINTESKYLLLQYAFETWQFIRVEFNIHKDNGESIDAIRNIGARHDGTLPKNIILPDGSQRTSEIYSVTDDLWESSVKAKIEQLLDEHPVPGEEKRVTGQTLALLEGLRKDQQAALEQTARRIEQIQAGEQPPAQIEGE